MTGEGAPRGAGDPQTAKPRGEEGVLRAPRFVPAHPVARALTTAGARIVPHAAPFQRPSGIPFVV
jgi:hypothetical protein